MTYDPYVWPVTAYNANFAINDTSVGKKVFFLQKIVMSECVSQQTNYVLLN